MRDYFALDVTAESTTTPVIRVTFDGPVSSLVGSDDDGTAVFDIDDPERLDMSYRIHDTAMTDDTSGVLAVTDRVTGDFILECNCSAEKIAALVGAARESDAHQGDGLYQFTLTINDEDILSVDRDLFLVYNVDGDLLRQHSLIPSGVEL